MMGLFLSLVIATLVGASLWLVQNSIRPVTEKLFSHSWHYYTGFIPVFFFLGGTAVVNRLIQLTGPVLTGKGATLIPGTGTVTGESLYPFGAEQGEAGSSLMRQLLASLSQLENRKELVLLVLSIWAIGAIVFLAVNVKRYREFKHSVLQGSRVCDTVRCPVKVIISANARTPMVMGLWKPIVIIPDIPLGEKELDMILTHELVHLKRGDLFIKLMVLVAQAAHWFNPVVCLLSRQLNTLCELSCDEKVVRKMDMESRRCYGEMILSMLDYSVMKRKAMNVVCVNSLCNSQKNVKRRLMNLMNAKKTKKSRIALSLMATVAIAGIGSYAAYAAESVVPATPKSHYGDDNYLLQGGRNITVQNLETGLIRAYDKEGNLVQPELKEKHLLEIKELTREEILERIKLHEEKGIPVPEAYLDALNNL